MIKKFLIISFVFLFSLPSLAETLACPVALPVDSPEFCSSFKVAAECNCTATRLPNMMCRNMRQLYNRMTTIFGSLEKACLYQKQTSKEKCINDWNCYLRGGTSSTGLICNGTGKACE